MMPGKKPSIVSKMFKKKWNDSPTCKNTPSGGRMIESIIRSTSKVYLSSGELSLGGPRWLAVESFPLPPEYKLPILIHLPGLAASEVPRD